MEIDLELIGRGGNPYERFCDSIRDSETRRKYLAYLRRFLDEVPDNVYGTVAGGAAAAGRSYEEKARLFVAVAKGNPEIGHGIIAEYVRLHKERVERGDLNPTRCATSSSRSTRCSTQTGRPSTGRAYTRCTPGR